MNNQTTSEKQAVTTIGSVAAASQKLKREYTSREYILVAVALSIGILFDRLVFSGTFNPQKSNAVFWLCYLIIFYALFWEKIRHNKVSWLVAGMCVMLCAWNFIFDPINSCWQYGLLTFMVIPCVLMAHAVYNTGGFNLKQVAPLALEWLCGWFIKPFSALPVFTGSIASMLSTGKNSTLKKVFIAIGITLPLLLILLPLLSGADLVFGYYMKQLFVDFNIGSFAVHTLLSIITTALFYSFLWNVGNGKIKDPAKSIEFNLDRLICGIVLGAVLAVYAMFCAVQFVYLFAGAGLPDGLTYSEYAREGFWQLVVVSGINLLIFGIFLKYVTRARWFNVMLAGLLAATALLLVSAILRLGLYIGTYGLTWLRLLSGWFIIYLAATLILCAVRMAKEKLPLIAVAALVLLVWYVALGYANPGMLIERYNLAFHPVL